MEALRMSTNDTAWWRHGHVWLLISGPALVVVAGVITAWIAVSHPDPVLGQDAPAQTEAISQPTTQSQERSLLPAQQARNHAATPIEAPLRRAP
jgi:hypothetical protein